MLQRVASIDVTEDVCAGAHARGDGVVLGFGDGRLERWAGGACAARSSTTPGEVIAVATNGERVVSLHDGCLSLRRLAGLEELARWPLAPLLAGAELARPKRLWDRVRPLCVALAPDGERALVGASSHPSYHLVDLQSGELLVAGAFGEFEEACGAVAFSPDGRTYAAGALADGDYYVDVYIHRAADHELLGCSTQHCLHVSDLAFSPDGRELARASRQYNYSSNGEALIRVTVPELPDESVEERPVEDYSRANRRAGIPFWGHDLDERYFGVRYTAAGDLVALCADAKLRLFGAGEKAALDVAPGAFGLDGDGVTFAVFAPRRVEVIAAR